MKKIIDKHQNELGKFSKKFIANLLEDIEVFNILQEIANKHKDVEVGNFSESGLIWDYTNIYDGKRWRFILGFSEIGYWIEINAPIEDLI